MSNHQTLKPILLASFAGAVLWFAPALLSGKREAWDSSVYWAIAYPAALIACGYLGYLYPRHPWRWALVLFEAQFLAMCVRNRELGNLWPLGVVLFAVIALPGVFVAKRCARIGSDAGAGTA